MIFKFSDILLLSINFFFKQAASKFGSTELKVVHFHSDHCQKQVGKLKKKRFLTPHSSICCHFETINSRKQWEISNHCSRNILSGQTISPVRSDRTFPVRGPWHPYLRVSEAATCNGTIITTSAYGQDVAPGTIPTF